MRHKMRLLLTVLVLWATSSSVSSETGRSVAPTPTLQQEEMTTPLPDNDYVCGCDLFPWVCVCENNAGQLVSNPEVSKGTGMDWTFNIDGAPSTSPILMKIYFFNTDVPQADKDWTLTVGPSTTFNQQSVLRNITEVYILSSESVVFNKDEDDYNILLYYEAIVPEHFTQTIPSNNMTGIINFPTMTSLDPDLGYAQQQRVMWVFDYPDNYIIEMNLTLLDLGYRQSELHWLNTLYDETNNDFLLVGLGTEIMESMDKVMYGHLEEMKTIRINHPSAHVVMFSSYHEQWAEGFEISFEALEVTRPSSTTTSAPTTTAPDLGLIPSTVAPIDDAQKGYNNNSVLQSSFRNAVAGMATEYVTLYSLDVESPAVIEPSEVEIYQVTTCLQDVCSEYCAAFNFSIDKMSKGRSSWAFSTNTLDQMIRDEKLQSHWATINEHCEFCEETVTVNWYLFGGVAAGAVLLAVLISLIVWKIRNVVDAQMSKEEIEHDLKQEELERRRRSSGDESVIGGLKGGTRMSLPFGAARGSVHSGQSSLDDEAEDFPEHDPDFGYDNFGLGSDLVNDNRARNFYSNSAFEPDSLPSGHIGYKQLHQAALDVSQASTSFAQDLPAKPIPILKSSLKKRRSSQEADDPSAKDRQTTPKKVITVVEEEDEDCFTDSDDSDGTVQFKIPSFGIKRQISIQADVHNPGDSDFGETVL